MILNFLLNKLRNAFCRNEEPIAVLCPPQSFELQQQCIFILNDTNGVPVFVILVLLLCCLIV